MIPANVYNVRISGALPSSEVWETGWWVQGALPTSNAEATASASLWLGLVADTDSGAWGSVLEQVSIGISLTTCRVYVYPDGGTSATFAGVATQTAQAGSLNEPYPNQSATVISLRTGEIGRSRRGRLYLPAAYGVLGSDHQMSSASTNNLAAAWGGMFQEWNAAGDNGTIVVVSKIGGGHAEPVTDVIVDSIPDTQRRRRNKVVASHVATATVTPE